MNVKSSWGRLRMENGLWIFTQLYFIVKLVFLEVGIVISECKERIALITFSDHNLSIAGLANLN